MNYVEPNICAFCDCLATEAMQETHFPYGAEDRVMLSAVVPVVTCTVCKLSHTDWRAEGLRLNAVCDHLGVLRPNDVRAIRDDLSRADFAAAIGVPEEDILRLETGRAVPRADIDRRIRDYGARDATTYVRIG